MMQALVIDDQAIVRRVFARMLRRLGFAVHEADDGLAGLGALAARPDLQLVMVDCRMPGISGIEVIAQIRRERRYQRTRVMMVTGLDDPIAGELALVAGADGVLIKPFGERELRAQLDHVGLPVLAPWPAQRVG